MISLQKVKDKMSKMNGCKEKIIIVMVMMLKIKMKIKMERIWCAIIKKEAYEMIRNKMLWEIQSIIEKCCRISHLKWKWQNDENIVNICTECEMILGMTGKFQISRDFHNIYSTIKYKKIHESSFTETVPASSGTFCPGLLATLSLKSTCPRHFLRW